MKIKLPLLLVALMAVGGALLWAENAVSDSPLEREAGVTASATAETATETQIDEYEDPLLRDAVKRLQAGNWNGARRKAKKALSKNKKSVEAWTVLGRCYLEAGQYRKAVRRFKKALKYDPHYANAYYWKAKAFEAWGKIDEAANEYQAAFHADPQWETAKMEWRRLKERIGASVEQ